MQLTFSRNCFQMNFHFITLLLPLFFTQAFGNCVWEIKQALVCLTTISLPNLSSSNPVILNQGAAAHYGAAKRCQGCCQIWNYCLFCVLLHKVPQNYNFQPIRGAAKFFKDLKGAANHKRLKNTVLT
jgi:hypothetical protein